MNKVLAFALVSSIGLSGNGWFREDVMINSKGEKCIIGFKNNNQPAYSFLESDVAELMEWLNNKKEWHKVLSHFICEVQFIKIKSKGWLSLELPNVEREILCENRSDPSLIGNIRTYLEATSEKLKTFRLSL